MASTLTVDNIVGATTAANVKLPAGCIVQVLDKWKLFLQTPPFQEIMENDFLNDPQIVLSIHYLLFSCDNFP